MLPLDAPVQMVLHTGLTLVQPGAMSVFRKLMTSFVSHGTRPCAPAPSHDSHVVATKAAMMTGAIA